jgi:hypothetical protein
MTPGVPVSANVVGTDQSVCSHCGAEPGHDHAPSCHQPDRPDPAGTVKTAGPHPSEAFNDEAAKRDAELLNGTDQPGGDDE